MKRTLVLATILVGLGLASAANAISVVVTANQATYLPGDTITLSVRGTTSDSPGTTDNSILGRILHNAALVTPLGNASQTALGGTFATGGLAACIATDCEVMDQISFPTPINPLITNFLIATVGYTAGAVLGPVAFDWKLVNPGKFDFFGLTNAPGVTVTIVPIPEPATAAMLGLGLFGLALAGRRRA